MPKNRILKYFKDDGSLGMIVYLNQFRQIFKLKIYSAYPQQIPENEMFIYGGVYNKECWRYTKEEHGEFIELMTLGNVQIKKFKGVVTINKFVVDSYKINGNNLILYNKYHIFNF